MEGEYITKSEKETTELGEKLASNLVPQDVVFLYGDLGSGKTTFVRGISKRLGVLTRIISPTFVVARSHTTTNKKIKKIYHLDLYRLKGKNDIDNLGLSDFLIDKNAVTLIEWPEKIEAKNVKQKIWKVYFEYLNNNERLVTIKNGEK